MTEHLYHELMRKILVQGDKRSTRAGDVYSIFGEKIVINVEEEFPLLTGRRIFYKPVLGELAAMLKGPKNIEDFKKYGCNYWDAWGAKEGSPSNDRSGSNLGGEIELDYGNSWLDFNGVNQLEKLVHTLKTNPTDRRMIISGWRPDRLEELSLPCCHMLYQWYVRENKYLDMIWYQRSVDVMVGLPSNFILAAAWNILLANECGYIPSKITMMLGDTHIYANHLDGAKQYLERPIRQSPIYFVCPEATVANFEPSKITIEEYEPNAEIKFKLNV